MNSILGKFVNVWLHPWRTMNEVKAQGEGVSIKASILFVVIMGLLSGLITSLMGMAFPPALVLSGEMSKNSVWWSLLIVPALSVLGSFVGAFILWGIIVGVLRGTLSQYKLTYRVLALLAAFQPISALLSPIPKVGLALAIAINVWATIIMIRGIIIVFETAAVRTWVMLIVIFGFLFALGLAARMAAENQPLGGTATDFGNLGGGLDEDLGTGTGPTAAPTNGTAGTNETSGNLNDQLQQRANEAKQDQKK